MNQENKREICKKYCASINAWCVWLKNDNEAVESVYYDVNVPCEIDGVDEGITAAFGKLNDVLDDFSDEAYEYAKQYPKEDIDRLFERMIDYEEEHPYDDEDEEDEGEDDD